MTARALVAADALRARTCEAGLSQDKIGTVAKIDRPRSLFPRCPALYRAGQAHLDAAESVAFDIEHGLFGYDLALLDTDRLSKKLLRRHRKFIARHGILDRPGRLAALLSDGERIRADGGND